MKIFRAVCMLLLMLLSLQAMAQEAVWGLSSNPSLAARPHAAKGLLKNLLQSAPDTLSLPFFDDFSSTTVTPDPHLWTDQFAFINNGFAVNPVTIGVATLDAFDANGALYSNASTSSFPADLLTSQCINLAYTPDSNIYLSFFYQAQGTSHTTSNTVDSEDSLFVQFYAPNQQQWRTVWITPGDSLRPSRQAFIHVSDTAFLQKGFRFRFGNYASINIYSADPTLAVANGLWNIDYVYLNKGRSAQDTAINDVAITQPLPSMLSGYESIPWTHFPAAANELMRSGKTSITYKNYSGMVQGLERSFNIRSLYSSYTYLVPTNSVNIMPYSSQVYEPYTEKFLYQTSDSARFRELFYLTTDTVLSRKVYRWNDTVSRTQDFYNYYAYDDGSAESGYGIIGDAKTAYVAMKFYSYIPDTLQAIQIYFNSVYNNLNHTGFDIAVWDNGDNQPGNLLYSKGSASLQPTFEKRNQFTTFVLDQPVLVTDTFYIGWVQYSNGFLNAGLDMNQVNNDKLYYNVTGSWKQSSVKGTVMMRPLLGKRVYTGISSPHETTSIQVYPNPTSDELFIVSGMNDGRRISYMLYDNAGKLILSGYTTGESINVSSLSPGMYLLRLQDTGGIAGFKKVLIVR